jgi:hypothetical protein
MTATLRGNDSNGQPNAPMPVTPEMAPKTWRDGMQAVNEIVGDILPSGKSQEPLTEMRTDDRWFPSGRSYQTTANLGITLHPTDARVSTIVHDMGHQIKSRPGLNSRFEPSTASQGSSRASLEVTGGNYNDDESLQ